MPAQEPLVIVVIRAAPLLELVADAHQTVVRNVSLEQKIVTRHALATAAPADIAHIQDRPTQANAVLAWIRLFLKARLSALNADTPCAARYLQYARLSF